MPPTQAAGYAGGGGGGLAYLLYDADHVEGPGPGVSTEILRRLGPGGLEGPAGSSLGDRKSAWSLNLTTAGCSPFSR